MPNVVGIWGLEHTEAAIQSVLSKQLERVRIAGCTYSEYAATFPGFGMALQDHNLLENGAQPVFSPDGQAVLLLDGEINNASELHQQFSADLGDEHRFPPALALQLILRKEASV